MSNFIVLFISGVVGYVVVMWLLSGLVDNSVKLDLDKERRLTEQQ